MKTKCLIRPFHKPIFKFIIDCDNLLSSLSLHYGDYLMDKTCDECFEIRISKENENRYLVSYNNNKIHTKHPVFIINDIIYKNTKFTDEVLALHGAAVEWNKKAYIFLAATTSGKTTLASFLTFSGFDYITDDCVLINKENLCIYPYNCPIHLREGGYSVLKQKNVITSDISIIYNDNTQRYIFTPKNCITNSLDIGGIFFIERTENINCVNNISTNESIVLLMKSPITTFDINVEYMKTIVSLSRCGCQFLQYKDMEFVRDIIKDSK